MGLFKVWSTKRNALKSLKDFQFKVNNIRRERAGQNRILKRKEKFKRFFSFLYPPWKKQLGNGCYDQAFVKGTRANSIGMLFRNIAMIEIFGIVMYLLMSFKYAHLPEIIGTTISIIIHVFLMFTLIFPKIMSYFMISIHVMLTTKVKNILLILIVTMAFEGPAMNIIRNIHQVASGVACVQVDVMSSKNDVEGNIMDKGEMMVSRFRSVFKNVAGPMNKMKRMLLTLDEKATKFVDIMRRHYHTITDLSNQCRKLLQTPYSKCLDLFDDSYRYCKQKVRYLGSHGEECQIIQKTAMICQQAQGFASEACSFPSIMTKGVKGAAVPFYSAYFSAIEFAVKKIFFVHIEATKWAIDKVKPVLKEIKNAAKIKAEYKSSDDGKLNAADDSTANLRTSIRKNLMKIVNFYVGIINVISFLLRFCIMPALLIWPFIYTLRFVYAYNYNDDFKNNFLTDEFQKIDQDCAFRNVPKALPLLADESKNYIWRNEWKMTTSEKPKYKMDVFLTIITCFTPICVCFLDFGVYTVLNNVQVFMNRTDIETPSHYELKVAGNGSMSEIMNEFLDVFSPFTKSIQERENKWRQCFPQPDPPNYFEIILMVFMFFVALFLCRLRAFLFRQSLALADHFYPHRVRIRALNLYNKILQGRRSMLTEMMGVAQTDTNHGQDVIARRLMQSRGFICADCTKCKKYDLRITDQENVRICIHCNAFYCIDCFSMTLDCIRCEENMQSLNDIELHYEEDGEEVEYSDPSISDNDSGNEDAIGNKSTDRSAESRSKQLKSNEP